VDLTSRDLELLDTLTRKVRVLTIQQIARTWWTTSQRAIENARERVSVLSSRQLLQTQRVPAHPELPLEAPAASWNIGEAKPDFGSVSYRLKARWKDHLVSTLCVSATSSSANRFSGHGGRFPRQVERSHDIHLAAVYLRYRQEQPELVPGWIFEEQLREEKQRRSGRLPDVIICTGSTNKVVEFGGAYPKAKLEAFHAYCKEQELPYEIW